MSCCPHPVERHAYNGCADCGCGVMFLQHPDRHRDTTPEGRAAVARWPHTCPKCGAAAYVGLSAVSCSLNCDGDE